MIQGLRVPSSHKETKDYVEHVLLTYVLFIWYGIVHLYIKVHWRHVSSKLVEQFWLIVSALVFDNQ